jgi:acyl-CoA hydrolase
MPTRTLTRLEDAVDALFAHGKGEIQLAAPLGLGKPHRLLNAIYQRVAADPKIAMQIYTALSLTPPSAPDGLAKRFLEPFVARHFGADFPRLDYAHAQQYDALPANIHVEEFYLQSGLLLGSQQAQQSYSSLNYTHVAPAVAARGINALVQKVAREPGGTRLSLSCNPDLTFDLVDEIARLGKPRPLLIAEVDSQLPFIGGTACAPEDFFDVVLDLPGPAPKLFGLPREPVSDVDYAIGLRASALVKDGGTLQIGIGSLSDALCHALILRHTRNAQYRLLLEALAPGYADSALVREIGDTATFETGLYGASELVNDGFRALHQAGILKRRVLDDIDAMRRINNDQASEQDKSRLAAEGRWLDGGFYLGSHDLYDWLREMTPAERRGIGMTRISHINELYGGNEALERVQRRDARFFNTCMMMTVLGAAVSDALEDGRVVSGVGGQYNFVAMAHALRDGRSALLFRASRGAGDGTASNVLWNYGHTTIPRHLRDIAISEYGVADLRGASDGECIERMLGLCEARFLSSLQHKARNAGKLPRDFTAPPAWSSNTTAFLAKLLRPYRQMGLLPDYPLGSDFTPVEQRLVKALGWLKTATASFRGKITAVLAANARVGESDREALQRRGLDAPKDWRERLDARLIALALNRTSGKSDT